MKYFYTGAENFLDEQKNPLLSLGGFISATPIPNAEIGNIFGDISQFTIDNQLRQTLAIALKNTTGKDAEDLILYFDFPTDKFSNIEIAAVIPATDSEGNKFVEKLTNSASLPFNATFNEADGVGNAINVGDLLKDDYLVFFLKRTIVDDIKDQFTCDALDTKTDEKGILTLVTSEDTDLVLNWTEV